MRGDDRLMTILTGVVLIIALGAVAQRGDILERFGAGPGIHPRDDVVEISASEVYAIDVAANDRGAVAGDGRRVLIMTAPSCGLAYRSGDRVIYQGGPECVGVQRMTYCIASGDDCAGAEVQLLVGTEKNPARTETATPVARLMERPSRPSDAAVSMAPTESGFVAETGPAPGERPLAGLASTLGSLAPEDAAQPAE